jgi:very-short-patch-repair endonuclease
VGRNVAETLHRGAAVMSVKTDDSIACRILDTINLEEVVRRGVKNWSLSCESPIETLLYSAMTITQALNGWAGSGPVLSKVLIVPQYTWNGYRIDFALLKKDFAVFVECDGHEFHERTPEQAERDRSRDRTIQEAGITIFRFTGREIFRNPFACADQIFQFVFENEARGKINKQQLEMS